jgi:ATP-dependent DNA helicase RecG
VIGRSARVSFAGRTEPREIRRLSGPLVMSFDAVMASVAARRRLTPLTLPRGQQIHLEDFPVRAVRELLSNALIHRDYFLPGSVDVSHSPQIFEMSSPGPLVTGVTPTNILTHESKPRNPTLAKTARMLGLAEEVGVGIDRVYREMLASGRDVPVIESFPDRVRVALIGGASNVRIPYYLSHLPAGEQEDVDTLLTLFTLCHRRVADAVALGPVLQKSQQAAEAVLRRLSQESVAMLEPSRGTLRRAHPRYRLRAEAMALLGTAVRYNCRLTDEVDRKIIAHVREYGKVTNRTVKNLFDVDVNRAAEILRDLVAREILVKISQATRGPSVEYGPGVAFPDRERPRLRPQTR